MLHQRRVADLSALVLLCLGLLAGQFLMPAATLAASQRVSRTRPDHPTAPTPPPYTTSWYKSTLSTSTSYNEGCAAAKGNPGIVILDFGEPAYQNGSYGTLIFDQNGAFASDSAIYTVGAAFVDGATACTKQSTLVRLSIGLSNYNGVLGSDPHTWYNAGLSWGKLINQLKTYASKNSHLGIYAADDIEVEWASYALTVQFVNGYNAMTKQWFVDYGDDSGGTNPSPWTAQEMWYITTGAPDDVVIPEIYYTVDATQDWEPMDIWSCQNKGRHLNIVGTMAENGYGGSLSPDQAWTAMYNAMGVNSCTQQARSHLYYSTNIQS